MVVDDGYDDEFYGDAADRAYLSSLTDIARENILYERGEQRRLAQEKHAMLSRRNKVCGPYVLSAFQALSLPAFDIPLGSHALHDEHMSMHDERRSTCSCMYHISPYASE